MSLPFILRKAGIAVPAIASIQALLVIPNVVNFLWSPVIDIGFRRKTWAILLTLLSTAFIMAAFLTPLPSATKIFVILAVISGIFGIANVAVGALASALPLEFRSEAGAWMQVGNLGGAALTAALFVWTAEHFSLLTVSLTVGALSILPVLPVVFVPETGRPGWSAAGAEFARLIKALRSRIKSIDTRMGAALLLSPVSAGAMTFLFSGIAADYHAGAKLVAVVTGLAGSLVTAAGALAGGFDSRRLGPRIAYATLGIAGAACAAGMALCKLSPVSYACGSMFYCAVAGAGWAVFTALVLDLVGAKNPAAGTWYATFVCIGNAPVSYMEWLDGIGYQHLGARGMLGVDALAGGLFSVVWLIVMLRRAPVDGGIHPARTFSSAL